MYPSHTYCDVHAHDQTLRLRKKDIHLPCHEGHLCLHSWASEMGAKHHCLLDMWATHSLWLEFFVLGRHGPFRDVVEQATAHAMLHDASPGKDFQKVMRSRCSGILAEESKTYDWIRNLSWATEVLVSESPTPQTEGIVSESLSDWVLYSSCKTKKLSVAQLAVHYLPGACVSRTWTLATDFYRWGPGLAEPCTL